jgi:hypothetical protein
LTSVQLFSSNGAVCGFKTVADSSERRRHHDSLHSGVASSTQHAQAPFARRDDQLVLVLRHGYRNRRGDVQDVFAACHSLRPARVLFEVGRDELQAVAGVCAARLEHRAYFRLAL